MEFARAIIATVLAVGLVFIIVIQELGDVKESLTEESIDLTMVLLVGAIVILTVPDAIAYFSKRRNGKDEDD